MNPGRRRFQCWIFTEENSPNMPEYRGLFDETISQRSREQRDKWRILAKPDGLFAGIFQ